MMSFWRVDNPTILWLSIRINENNEVRRKCLKEFGISEMERDAMISHGASQVLLERLFLQSDPYESLVCEDCGLFAMYKIRDSYYCKSCNSYRLRLVKIPYACKLLFQEIMSMMIKPSLVLKV